MDISRSYTKAGWSGEDSPKCVFPSSLGHLKDKEGDVDMETEVKKKFTVGESLIMYPKEDMELESPIEHGLGIYFNNRKL